MGGSKIIGQVSTVTFQGSKAISQGGNSQRSDIKGQESKLVSHGQRSWVKGKGSKFIGQGSKVIDSGQMSKIWGRRSWVKSHRLQGQRS